MAKLRVGYLASNTGSIPFSARADGRYLMKNSGENTGNLAFWYAVRRMFDEEILFVNWGPNGAQYRDKVDRLVIPAANHLNPQWDLGALADLIESLDKEVIVFGLGAQAQEESEHPNLQKGTQRYLEALGSHATTLFVRGSYTADICIAYGVKNVEPIGCPSITINPDPELGALIASRHGQKMVRLYCAGAAYKEENSLIERALFQKIKHSPGSSYVIQTPHELIDLARGSSDISLDQTADRIWKILDPQSDKNDFRENFMRVTRYYGSVGAWLEAAAHHQYSVNTRIHGAILSLMAGVPTIVIGHDTRIRELCDIMLIPCLRPSEALKKIDIIEELFSDFKIDADAFDINRSKIAQRYKSYLLTSGLTPSNTLISLSDKTKAVNP